MNLSKKQEYLIIAGLLVLIFPFFALMLYTHPQSDDYVFANMVPELGVFGFVNYMYLNWTGRYFTMFLAALNPWVYNSINLYHICLIVYFVFFIASVYCFTRSISLKNQSRRKSLIISLFLVFFFLQINPDLFEFLYWYPGVIGYQVAISMFLITLSLLFSFLNNRINSYLFIIYSITIVSMLVGTNELVFPMVFVSYSFILGLAKKVTAKKKRVILNLLILYSIVSLVFILSPGNYLRLDILNSTSIINPIEWSFLGIGYLFISLLQNSSFIISLIIFILFAYNNTHLYTKLFTSIKPLYLVSLSLLIIVVMFLFVITTLRDIPTSRVVTVMLFVTILLIVINIFNLSLLSNHKVWFTASQLNKLYKLLFLGMISLSIFGFSFSSLSKFIRAENSMKSKYIYFHSNLSSATYALLFESSNFLKSFKNLDRSLYNASANNLKTTRVKSLPRFSKLLFRTENLAIKNTWIKCSMTDYYTLDSIYIEPRDNQRLIKEK